MHIKHILAGHNVSRGWAAKPALNTKVNFCEVQGLKILVILIQFRLSQEYSEFHMSVDPFKIQWSAEIDLRLRFIFNYKWTKHVCIYSCF